MCSSRLAHAVGFIWKHPLADAAARSAAPAGVRSSACCAHHRRTMGRADVGDVVGLDPRLVSVLICSCSIWLYRALGGDRGPGQGGQGGGGAGPCRRGQYPGHPFLGRLVELAASARQRHPHRGRAARSLDPREHALAAPRHGRGLSLPVRALTMLRLRTEIHLRRARTLMLSRGAA